MAIDETMLKPERFRTIYKEGKVEFVEKKSRFIGQAFPVESEEAAVTHIEAVKKEHQKLSAGHIPYAWLIGNRSRHNDAGEPGGTAGMPILDFFKKEGLTNILVTVVRYYGGIPLGAGGLVRAYGAAAKLAVYDAGIIEKTMHNKFSVSCPYNLQGKFRHEFMKQGYTIADTNYTETVELIVLIEKDAESVFETAVADISAGTAKVHLLDSLYCAKIGDRLVEF